MPSPFSVPVIIVGVIIKHHLIVSGYGFVPAIYTDELIRPAVTGKAADAAEDFFRSRIDFVLIQFLVIANLDGD